MARYGVIVVDHAGLMALTDDWELGGRELTEDEMAAKREAARQWTPIPPECARGTCEHGCLPF